MPGPRAQRERGWSLRIGSSGVLLESELGGIGSGAARAAPAQDQQCEASRAEPERMARLRQLREALLECRDLHAIAGEAADEQEILLDRELVLRDRKPDRVAWNRR